VASEMTRLRAADAISTFCQFTLRSECRLIVSNGRMRGSDFGFRSAKSRLFSMICVLSCNSLSSSLRMCSPTSMTPTPIWKVSEAATRPS
jgi:hypothetical protein